MTSEWMKVMLDEIARKKVEVEEARLEEQRRDASIDDAQSSDAPPHAKGARLAG
jgi:hypothetical protein